MESLEGGGARGGGKVGGGSKASRGSSNPGPKSQNPSPKQTGKPKNPTECNVKAKKAEGRSKHKSTDSSRDKAEGVRRAQDHAKKNRPEIKGKNAHKDWKDSPTRPKQNTVREGKKSEKREIHRWWEELFGDD